MRGHCSGCLQEQELLLLLFPAFFSCPTLMMILFFSRSPTVEEEGRAAARIAARRQRRPSSSSEAGAAAACIALAVLLAAAPTAGMAMVGIEFLGGVTLHLFPSSLMFPERMDLLERLVVKRGGSLASEPSKSVSYMVCDEAVSMQNAGVKEALGKCAQGCAAVQALWLCHCESNGKILPTDSYKLRAEPEPALAGEKDKKKIASREGAGRGGVEGDAGGGGVGIKRQRDEDDAQNPTQAKKVAAPSPDKPGLASIFMKKPSASANGWQHNAVKGTLTWRTDGFVEMEKAACFDLDSTLIKTKTGNTFPSHQDDWQLIEELQQRRRLNQLIQEGHCIVIISNQVGAVPSAWWSRPITQKSTHESEPIDASPPRDRRGYRKNVP